VPRERRQIIFSEAELYEALVGYNRVAAMPAFRGDPFSIVIGKEPSITVSCRVYDYRGDWKEETERLPGEFVREALIRFCLENNIGLPRSGVKRILAVDQEICLFVVLEPVRAEKGR
jgi:hypothetical protein